MLFGDHAIAVTLQAPSLNIENLFRIDSWGDQLDTTFPGDFLPPPTHLEDLLHFPCHIAMWQQEAVGDVN